MIGMRRVQSVFLALAMVISANSFTSDAGSNVVQQLGALACKNKAIACVMMVLIAAKIQLMTQPRVEYTYSWEEFKKEVEDLCSVFNIFDKATCAKIAFLYKKYFVGAELKIEDTTTRTKNDDGSVFTIKGKKLVQKPSGLMGLVDAYVLSQAKKVVDLVPALAALYLLINDPYKMFTKDMGSSDKSSDNKSSNIIIVTGDLEAAKQLMEQRFSQKSA